MLWICFSPNATVFKNITYPLGLEILTTKQLLWRACNENYKRDTATACNPHNPSGSVYTKHNTTLFSHIIY